MSALFHLAAINFFTGDIQGGLGPFLATWLAETGHWNAGRIGLVTTIAGLASLVLNGPAGALVDRSGRPRLLLVIACGAILAGTLLLLPARSFFAVTLAQFLAAAGGTLVLPALTSLTLGIVGKEKFPGQQGRNQAFNHAGILVAALVIAGLGHVIGSGAGLMVLASMAVLAILAVIVTPPKAWNGRRAHGWQEEEGDDHDRSHPILAVLGNRRLMLLAVSLALFNLGNGTMLSLVAQRLVATHIGAASWLATYVMVAQVTMIPVALWAGSVADRRGRRHLLLFAFAALVLRAVLSATITAPAWLIPAEILDGVASGLIGVAVPVLVADLTWGSGRTQTALGAVNTVQGIGGALSGAVGGLMADWFGWTGGLLALGVPAVLALVMALWLEETRALNTPYSTAS